MMMRSLFLKTTLLYLVFVVFSAAALSLVSSFVMLGGNADVVEHRGFLNIIVYLVGDNYGSALTLFVFISGLSEIASRVTGVKRAGVVRTKCQKLWLQIQTWIISFLVCWLGTTVKLGLFSEIVISPVVDAAIAGIVLGLWINGMYDFVQNGSGAVVEQVRKSTAELDGLE